MFSATRNYFRNGKQLARKGVKAPPKSALFDRRLRHERIAIFSNRRGDGLTLKISIMEKNRPTRKGRGGPAKTDTASHCVMVRFNDTEHARFLTMYEQSELLSKAAFIKARVFGDVFRVIKTDRGTLEYVSKLTQLHAQYRAIGINYNQIVKELRIRFSERKALSLLYKPEKATMQLVEINPGSSRFPKSFKSDGSQNHHWERRIRGTCLQSAERGQRRGAKYLLDIRLRRD